jgi:dephospho-CoA kinase
LIPEPAVNRFVVGIAGGVGSGKSTVAALFRNWGARVLDADAIGHRVIERPDVKARLVRAWGPGILRGGRVDRARLAREAFRSRDSVRLLNRLVHPAILREIRRRIARSRRWVVLDAALLFEAGADRLCDRVVFVEAPRRVRRRRAAARGMGPEESARRERFQRPAAYKKRRADDVIDNAGSKSRTEKQAREIYEGFRRLMHPSPI